MSSTDRPAQEIKAADLRSSNDVDDQFRALMEGLRTTIPGVMILVAFLLTLPSRRPLAK